jgi:colanic acid/amylovoran biosynthesis glycosyltransferase
MPRMKEPAGLAYIIGTYPGLTTTFIDQEIRILRDWGLNLKPVSIRRPPASLPLSPEQRELQQETIYLLPLNWPRFLASHLFFMLRRPLIYFKTIIYLLGRPHPSLVDRFKTILHFGEGVYAAFILRHEPSCHVHAHFVDRASTVALIVGRLLDLPYSVTAHANDIYKVKVLLCEKLREASFVVTVSEFNKSYLLDVCSGLNPAKIHVLHPWVDMSRFQPLLTRPVHPKLQILSVGRLVEKKGHSYLIEACHLLVEKAIDFECRIIGDGPLKAELETQIERLKLKERVFLLGAQPHSEVIAHLNWCDIFVLACVVAKDGDRDGMPVSLAEAMAMAVPVASCDLPGIDELVRPGTGLLVPPRDSHLLAEALQSIHALSPSDRTDMGVRGRAVVDADFSLLKGTRRLMALFQDESVPN